MLVLVPLFCWFCLSWGCRLSFVVLFGVFACMAKVGPVLCRSEMRSRRITQSTTNVQLAHRFIRPCGRCFPRLGAFRSCSDPLPPLGPPAVSPHPLTAGLLGVFVHVSFPIHPASPAAVDSLVERELPGLPWHTMLYLGVPSVFDLVGTGLAKIGLMSAETLCAAS